MPFLLISLTILEGCSVTVINGFKMILLNFFFKYIFKRIQNSFDRDPIHLGQNLQKLSADETIIG